MNEDIVLRHVEDVAFLWERRRAVLRTNRLTHEERIVVELRLEAHIDAAVIAGLPALELALALYASQPRPGLAFLAAVLSIRDLGTQDLERALAKFHADPRSVEAIISAIGWSSLPDVERALSPFLSARDEYLSLLAIAGFTTHRRPQGTALGRGLKGLCPSLRAASAKAAGELATTQYCGLLVELLKDGDPGVRFRAARSLARLDPSLAMVHDVLLAATCSGMEFSSQAAATLIRLMGDDGLALYRDWARVESLRKLALVAAETLGRHEVVEELIPWMDDDCLARSAGEAFRTITGADLETHGLARPRPAFVPGDPSDDPSDPCVDLPMDYDLAFPSRPEVTRWWDCARERYLPGVTYLNGTPIGSRMGPPEPQYLGNLRTAVLTGRSRHRMIASSALGHVQSTRPTIETHAFATPGHCLPGWDPAPSGD